MEVGVVELDYVGVRRQLTKKSNLYVGVMQRFLIGACNSFDSVVRGLGVGWRHGRGNVNK